MKGNAHNIVIRTKAADENFPFKGHSDERTLFITRDHWTYRDTTVGNTADFSVPMLFVMNDFSFSALQSPKINGLVPRSHRIRRK